MTELVKIPVPVPSPVQAALSVSGSPAVFQQTPLAVTNAPPSSVTWPPRDAVVMAMLSALLVVTVGKLTETNDFISPYPVPRLLEAYAPIA